jgi:hypothetical protein
MFLRTFGSRRPPTEFINAAMSIDPEWKMVLTDTTLVYTEEWTWSVACHSFWKLKKSIKRTPLVSLSTVAEMVDDNGDNELGTWGHGRC